MIKKIIAVLVLSLFTQMASAQVIHNLIVNGSFEEGHLVETTSRKWGLFNSLPGWQRDAGATAQIEVQAFGLNGKYPAQGRHYIELDSTQNYSLYQNVSVEGCQPYLLSFEYMPRNSNTATNGIELIVDGEVKLSLARGDAGWQSYSVQVTPATDVMQVRFRGTGTSDSIGAFLDNVRLVVSPVLGAEEILLNGSFEENHGQTANGFVLLNEMGVWKSQPSQQPVPFEIQGNISGILNSVDGTRKVELDGTKNSSIRQTVGVTSGESYLLKVRYAPRDVAKGASNNVDVLVDGQLLSTIYHNVKEWRIYQFALTPQNDSIQVELRARGKSDGFGGLVDSVELTEVGGPANLLENPSFEAPLSLSSQNWALFNSIPGWESSTFNMIQNPFELQYGLFNPPSWPARNGLAAVELDSTGNSSVYQDVQTTEGQTYLLRFSYGPRVDNNLETNKAVVKWNGQVVANLNGTKRGWSDYYFVVTGAAETSRLSFEAQGTSDSLGALIDFVSVRELITDFGPIADFNVLQIGEFPNVTIALDATPSTGNIVTYQWRYGGPTFAETTTPHFSFEITEPGSYDITLTTIDSEGRTSYHYKRILVDEGGEPSEIGTQNGGTVGIDLGELPPVVSANSPANLETNEEASFDATSSFSYSGAISLYEWNFGDGQTLNSTQAIVTHAYTAAGIYFPTLKVTDSNGRFSILSLEPVTVVTPIPPEAVIQLSSTTGRAPYTFTVNASSSLPTGKIGEYLFDFGDGTILVSETPIVQHTYLVEGNYSLKLKVTESTGSARSAETEVLMTIKERDDVPVASVNTTATEGRGPLTVLFDATLSFDDKGITQYSWNFGDGSSVQIGASLKNVQHTYTTSGSFNAVLTLTDTVGQTTTKTIPVVIAAPALHLADFAIINDSSVAPATITFDARTTESSSNIFQYQWVIDGQTINKNNPVLHHTFPQSGNFDVTLTVTSSDGSTRSQTKTVNITSATSGANFLFTAQSTVAPSTMQFDGSISTAGPALTDYIWDFGDGTRLESTTAIVNHVYTQPGVYPVKLSIRSAAGSEGEITKNIVVGANAFPVAKLNADKLAGLAPLTVNFSSLGSVDDENIVSYELNYGDGSLSSTFANSFNQAHVYSSRGVFQATLTVRDRQGKVTTSTRTISVERDNTAPIANFTITPASGANPLAVTLDATTSSDDEAVKVYQWTLSNGVSVKKSTPVFNTTLTTPGLVQVRLDVYDAQGLKGTKTDSIRVNTPPVPNFVATVDQSVFPARVTLDASTTSDDASGATYTWALDEGTILIPSTTNPVSEVFISNRGIHRFVLTVTDSDGETRTLTKEVRINSLPEALAIVNPMISDYPVTVQYNASISKDDVAITFYSWELVGEGVLGTTPSGSISFEEEGVYLLRLTVVDSDGQAASKDYPVLVRSNPAPVASFTATPETQNLPAKVKFDARASSDDKNIALYKWNFGSEGYFESSSHLAEFIFQSAGPHEVVLTVVDSQGTEASTQESLSFQTNAAPVAALVADVEEGEIPLAVKFDASTTTDDEAGIEYSWNFGEGPVIGGSKISYTFKEAGSFEVTVTATDRQGLSSQASVTIDTTDATQTDTQAPTILAGPESGPIAENQNEVVLALNDDTAVNYESLRVYWNNALLPPERITVDAPNNIVRVSTGTITQGESFTLGVKVTDNAGNLASKGFYYQVLTPVPADTFGPIVNFIPQGGDLTTLTPQITVALYDPAGVDFSQIQAYLNGDLIPGARITTDSANSRFIITLDQDLSLTANEINTIQVSVRDTIGNVSLAGVGFDTRTEKTTIVEVPGVSQIGLSMGNVHSCHITADRNVKCWGFGTSGYLGYGNTQNLGDNETVDQIPTVEIGGFAEQLALGAGHSCVLLTDGNVRCWGLSDQGQLGNGDNVTIGDNEIPTSRPVVSLGGAAAKIVTGGFHNCILKNSGGLLCWGYNAFGQLGQSTTQNIGDNELPSTFADINVGGTSPVVDVATGNFHTCALTAAGEVKCWGRNNFRQIGSSNTALLIGDNEAPSTQAFLNIGGVATAIAVGAEHSCALLQNKRVKCWGRNDVGQLGIATTVVPLDATSAPLVDVGEDVDKIAAGGNNTCVITVTGKAKCWGVNNTGQLGLGNTLTIGDNEHPSSVPHIELGSLVSFVEPGGNHTCAVTDTSLLYCWGNGSLGRLGYGNTQTIGDNELPITAGPVNINGLGGPQTVIAKVSSNPSSGEIPLTVSFDGTESSSTVGAIQNYRWDYGDGTIVDEATGTPQHTYTQVGVFLVTLTVRDGNNNEATVKTAVSVDADVVPPVARFIADADAHKIGDDFTFDASTSYDPKGSVESYYWNFGDGQVLSTTNPIATHSYQALGIFLVSLKVYGSDNRVSSETFYPVFVNDINEAPLARLSCTPGNYEVTCTAANSVDYDGFIGAFEWDMGDGTPYTTESVTHSYPVPGNGKYKVKLTVHDNGGSSHTIESQDYIFDTTAPVITSNLTSQTITNSRVDYQINVDDENFTTTEIWLNNQKVLTSDDQSLAGRLVLANGTNQVQLRAFDGAGNQATALNYTIQAQNTAPVIQLADPGEVYTNNPSFTVAFDVVDDSSTKASIILNNQIVLQDSTSKNISHPITLAEGTNRIEVVVLDEALQVARQEITGITLDTTAPRLISIKPTNGKRYIGQTQFNVSGEANEPLIAVTIDGDGVTLTPNAATFEYPKTQPAEGEHSYTIVLTDRAGNTTEAVRTYEVLQHILYGQLVTVIPDNGELRVVGMPGATRYPNQEVEISGGFLNSTTVTANADGSFEGRISFTNSIELFAESVELGFSESYRINYAVDTTLSGVVKDNQDNPLPGVTVRITSSGQTAITNEGGVFSIPSPATGDQQVEIDGTTIPETVTLGVKKFSKTKLSVNLGFKDLNVLPRAVYLTPINVDGTETVVEPGQAVSVTSANVTGVQLDIPAGSAIFPPGTAVEINGEFKNVISISEIPAERASIAVMAEARPDTVYSFEPSGLKFTTPAKLTLPNTNEFGVGTRVVIISKNSETGEWGVDGSGEVTAPDRIETLPGQGITHFSELYAVPYGLEVASRSNGQLPTIDSQSGGLFTAIDMPSFRVMGQDIKPALIYKSNWAQPNVLVSNVFNLDRTYNIQRLDALDFGLTNRDTVSQEVWSSPESASSTFKVADISGEKIEFNITEAPKEAVISYVLDLDEVSSGAYFANAEYEITYKHLVKTSAKVDTGDGYKKFKIDEREIFEKIFPTPLGQIIHVQNKKNSEYGAGWKLNLSQEILNPESPRLVVEESSGATSGYVIDNTIESVAYDAEGIFAAALDSSELVSFYSKEGQFKQTDLAEDVELANAAVDVLFDVPTFQVDQQVDVAHVLHRSSKRCSGAEVFGSCQGHWYYNYQVGCGRNRFEIFPEKDLISVRKVGSDYYYLDSKGAIYKNNSTENHVTGAIGRPARLVADKTKSYPNLTQKCESDRGYFCNSTNRIFAQTGYKSVKNKSPGWVPSISNCGTVAVTTSTNPFPEPELRYSNYPLGNAYVAGTLTQSKYNQPLDFVASKAEGGVFYVADTGNNIVRKVFANGNLVQDFAGNRSVQGNELASDGMNALNAVIIHPRGLETDSSGNVYIASANGLVWRVDTTGKIRILAGKTPTAGPLDNSTLDKVKLSSPTGLALNEETNTLYVADTGNNRIVALDLTRKVANQVAGNLSCQSGPEFIRNGSPALDVSLCSPMRIGLDESKNLLVLDKSNKMVRRINLNYSDDGRAVYKSLAKDNSSVIRNEDGTFTRVYRDLTEVTFSSLGKQTQAKDRIGNTTSYNYSSGKLVSIVDPKGGISSLAYSGGKLQTFTDPVGRETDFIYEGEKLVGVQYADSTMKGFDYETDSNLLVSETNQRNFTTTYQYGPWKRLSRVIRPDNTNIQIAEELAQTVGNSYTGGTLGELKSYGEGNSEGNELVSIYTNAKGIETKLTTDLKGYVSIITDANDRETTIQRNLDGKPTKIIRHDGAYTEFVYNSKNDLISKYESAADIQDAYSYNPEGQLLSYTTESNGVSKTSSSTYFANGLINSSVDFNGKTISRTYRADGLVASVKNDLNETSQMVYDVRGNLYQRIAPKGEETTLQRDIAGNIIQKTDAKGGITKYGFDVFNRLVRVETGITLNRPIGDVTTYQFSETGRLTQITDPQSNITTFEYNSLEQLIKKTTSIGQITELAYDPNGNVVWEKDPNGNIKTFEYSDTDQLLRKILPDNLYQMTYDDNDNLTAISDNDSAIAFTYEKVGDDYLIKTVDSQGTELPNTTLTNSYDRFGNRTQMQTPYGNFGYAYDMGNRLTNVSNPFGENFGFQYDDANRLRLIVRPGSTTNLEFDQNSFLTSMVHKRGASTITQALYTSDAVGNRITKITPEGSHNYSYDEHYQLKTATNPEGGADYASESFNYDSLGNRTNDQLGSYIYDNKKQRLLEDYQNFYSYDNNGNLITKSRKGMNGSTVNYIYSSDNQLVEVQFFENYLAVKSVFYRYDALGRRTQRTVVNASNPTSPNSKIWIYDGGEIVAELDAEFNVLAVYTHSSLSTDDTLSVRVTSEGVSAGIALASGSYQYLKDALGSISVIVDNSGNLIQRYVYSIFGKVISIKDENSNDLTNPRLKTNYAFTNREWDEDIGLYYFRTRYYDQSIGRFISEDSHQGRGILPSTFINKYLYGQNSPANLTDPTGESPFLLAVMVAAFLGFEDPMGIMSFIDRITKPVFQEINDFYTKYKYKIIGVGLVLLGTALIPGAGLFGAAVGLGIITAGVAIGTTGRGASSKEALRRGWMGFLGGFLTGLIGGFWNWSAGIGFLALYGRDASAGKSEQESLQSGAQGAVIGGAAGESGGAAPSGAGAGGGSALPPGYVPIM